jgi:hypothetical protein
MLLESRWAGILHSVEPAREGLGDNVSGCLDQRSLGFLRILWAWAGSKRVWRDDSLKPWHNPQSVHELRSP